MEGINNQIKLMGTSINAKLAVAGALPALGSGEFLYDYGTQANANQIEF
ncbi:hypothetical protein [Synechococcus sp. C9]|jgi:hypothetical protein|nr:hypothetical protein [Synechococcus sp. C9]